MEVTKEHLEAYRSKRQEIKELQSIVANRWKDEKLIGNDVVLDYRKGYPVPQSVVGPDLDRYEYLQDRDRRRIEKLEAECRAVEDFVDSVKDTIGHRILRMYYIDGEKPVTQHQVAKTLHLERSTISKKIDQYLKLSHKSQKSHL